MRPLHRNLCQVQYHHRHGLGPIRFPHCATGHLLNIQAAYTAYPEAVGQKKIRGSGHLYITPATTMPIIQVGGILMQRVPEAVAYDDYRANSGTPLHMSDQFATQIVQTATGALPTIRAVGGPKIFLHLSWHVCTAQRNSCYC
jgi:hypothetical protein